MRRKRRTNSDVRKIPPAPFTKGEAGSSVKRNGFTLKEVSIVIFIMLIMTSITVPWLKTFAESTQLRSGARNIRSLMEFARSSAVTQRTEYVVLFDTDQQEYWLSLLSFVDDSSGQVTSDASRTSLSESLAALSESEVGSGDLLEEDEEEQSETAFSRTGGILGIPKQLPNGIQIAQILSPRSPEGNSQVDYVAFYPDGTAEDCEIYLQSPSDRIFLISVSEATGRAGLRELGLQEIEELGITVSPED